MKKQNHANIGNPVFLLIAAVSGFLSVVLGAFAAHGLQKTLAPELIRTFQTGVDYQAMHALALLGIALLPQNRWSFTAGWSLITGIFLFSGSLYLLALSDTRSLGMITPVGGVFFLAGWACLFIYAWKRL